MKYKLLVSDLDSTLISKERGLTDGNKIAIKKSIEKGLKVFLCSGRSYLSLAKYEKELDINKEGFYGICFNGSMIYETHSHNVIYEKMLEKELALTIINKVRKYDILIIIYSRDKLYAESNIDKIISDYSKDALVKVTPIDKFENINGDISKILLKGDVNILEEIFVEMQKYINNNYNMFYSATDMLEFTNLDATKGKAMEFLANYLNIDLGEIIAVGDNYNDLSMIKSAGLGVSVKNGVLEAKQMANYVTLVDNENDAIKEILEKFVL